MKVWEHKLPPRTKKASKRPAAPQKMQGLSKEGTYIGEEKGDGLMRERKRPESMQRS